MHQIDKYQEAVAFANERTFEVFKIHGPYKVGSETHKFWLKIFDKFYQ